MKLILISFALYFAFNQYVLYKYRSLNATLLNYVNYTSGELHSCKDSLDTQNAVLEAVYEK